MNHGETILESLLKREGKRLDFSLNIWINSTLHKEVMI